MGTFICTAYKHEQYGARSGKQIESHLTFAPGVKVEQKQWDSWKTLTGPMDAVGALTDDGRSVRIWWLRGRSSCIKKQNKSHVRKGAP